MRFGRVEGSVHAVERDGRFFLRLTVHLESGRGIRIVRDEEVAPIGPIETLADLQWQADQFTQETIGVDLAEEGWEVIGAGDAPEPEENAPICSASYAVRNLAPG